ncbi:protein kinase [Roseburia hominis]
MRIDEEYRLSEYQDLGALNTRKNIRLKRHKISGIICVEKRAAGKLFPVYQYLKENSSVHIPKIYECIPDKDEIIIIEEYIEGRTLADLLTERCMEEEETVQIALELCSALKILHHATPMIICRDLKAENVIIDKTGHVKLIDFNIARIFREGQHRDTVLLGTAEYAAPEQFGYFQTDNRTDIYALGVLINYMLSGKFPVEQIVRGKMEKIVRKCISLEPKERYQSVEEIEREFVRLYRQYPVSKQYGNEGPNRGISDFLLPGFRSKKVWKMAIAVMGYAFITWFCFSLEIEKNGIAMTGRLLRFEQTMIWISQILFVGVVCNYLGCSENLPLVKSKRWWVRGFGYVLVYFVLLVAAAFVCAAVEFF